MWCRMWKPVQAVESQVPEYAGCGCWLGGVRKLLPPGVMLSVVAVMSTQSCCRVRRAFIIPSGLCAGPMPSALLLSRTAP